MGVINGQAVDVNAAVQAVREAIDRAYLGPSTAHIVASATDRRIPHLRLNEGNLVQLGHGKRQHQCTIGLTNPVCDQLGMVDCGDDGTGEQNGNHGHRQRSSQADDNADTCKPRNKPAPMGYQFSGNALHRCNVVAKRRNERHGIGLCGAWPS
jgi:hypothetical protein